VWGALRGLETLSQLIYHDDDGSVSTSASVKTKPKSFYLYLNLGSGAERYYSSFYCAWREGGVLH
jgi:hypothetical protein